MVKLILNISWLSVCCFSIIGCVTTTARLDSQVLSRTKSIAFIASNTVNQIRIIDRKEYHERTKQAVGAAVGGGLFGGVISASTVLSQGSQSRSITEADKKIQSINSVISQIKFDEILADGISKKLSRNFKVLNIREANGGRGSAQLYFKIRYDYGLGVYKKGTFNAILDGVLSVYDNKTNNLLLTKAISSDQLFFKPNSLIAFVENDGELFRVDLLSAIDAFAELISQEFLPESKY